MTRTGRFYAEIYGCSLNRGEAELVLRALEAAGHSPVGSPDDGDLALLFTCTVVGTTERRMVAAARALPTPLLIGGCMASAQADLLQSVRPDARLFAPPGYGDMIDEALGLLSGGPEPVSPPPEGAMRVPPGAGTGRSARRERDIRRYPLTTGAHIVPIASGCLGDCRYCITKMARPALESRPMEEVARLVAAAARGGAAEIRLSAQDAAAYGRDIGADLPSLLRRLTSGPGPMIRVGMMNPDTVAPVLDDLIRAYDSDRIFRFLHLPLQSGSDAVLAAMGRRYSVDEHSEIVAAFRRAFPGMTLTTDVIVGYPGETEEDFEATVRAIGALRPEVLNITRFSPRPGTPAADLRPLPGSVVKARSRRLTDLHGRMAREAFSPLIGRTLRVVMTEPGRDGTSIARDIDYRPVVVMADLPVGTWTTVEIVDATRAYLRGRPTGAGSS